MRRVMLLIILTLLSLKGLVKSSHAFSPIYSLGVESQGSREVVQPSLFSFLDFSLKDSEETPNLDLRLRMYFNQPKVHAFSSKNAHFTLMNEGADTHIRYELGRSWFEWNELDEIWGLGTFNVLDSWDRLRSSSQGLTGLFIKADTQMAQFTFFVSYLSIPELMPNVILENEQFKIYHPQAVAAGPQTFELLDRPTPLGYHLVLPNLSRILFRPSAAFSFKTRALLDPLKFKFSLGYLPLNHFPIAFQASMSIPLDQIVVNLRPRLLSHIVYSSDLSVDLDEALSAGTSLMIDQVIPEEQIPTDYTTATLGTLTSISPWIKVKSLRLSYLHSSGGLGTDVGPYADPIQNLFSSRILYRNALQFEMHLKEWFLKYLHEFSVNANWIALDWKKQWNSNWNSVIGGDLISAEHNAAPERGAEFLSDMRAIDRIRLGLQYVF